MDSTTIAAILGAIATVIAAIIGYVSTKRNSQNPQATKQVDAQPIKERPVWPEERTLEALKRRLRRTSEKNLSILRALAQHPSSGMYRKKLGVITNIDLDELVYRGRELERQMLIELVLLTDVRFDIHEEILQVVGGDKKNLLPLFPE